MSAKEDGGSEFGSEFNAETNLRNSIMVMQAINDIQFEEKFIRRFKDYAPMVAKELMAAGVKFPSASHSGEGAQGESKGGGK